MKPYSVIKALVLPLLLAFLLLLPLLGAAVIGEHRYARSHPDYLHHFWMYLLGEEDAEGRPIPLPAHIAQGGELATATATGEGPVRILVMGQDRAAGLTDVMMIATLDPREHSLELLQIPRDTYAAYTQSSYKKLNGAYAKLGGEGLLDFLRENMGISLDHYVCADLSVLGELVDRMGGVHLNVPQNMDYDDPAQELHIHIKAGEQTLDGQKAQQFVRFRSGYARADLGRMDAQKLFLSALARDAQKNLSRVQMVNLICHCFGRIKTDMSLGDCLRCAKALRAVDLSRMRMTTLPGESARTGGDHGAWYYILNRDATARLLFGAAEDAFDPGELFTDPACPFFDAIYRAPGEHYQTREYTAKDTLAGAASPAAFCDLART